jgi:large subunit ribosomal protein L25
MTKTIEMKATAREKVGKGAARAVRREGLVPAVIYGGKEAPLAISLPYKETYNSIYAGGFLTHVVELDVDGKKHRVLPKDYQLDVVKGKPLHIDFLRINKDSRVIVEVPVHFLNEETCPGIKRGGVLNIVRHEIEVSVPADAIPSYIEVDLANAQLGESIHVSAVNLGEGVTPTITDRDFTIATIASPAGLKSDDEDEAVAPTEVPASKQKAKE